MPNWCHFEMIIGGRREDVDLFCSILGNDYDEIHMSRIIDPEVDHTEDYGLYRRAFVHGECAWSVYCCMMDGPLSYYGDYVKQITEPPHPRTAKYFKLPVGPCTNIKALSRQLNLDIAILSEEPGMCFSELYKIKNGEVLTDETGVYEELWIDDYKTWDEVVDYYGEEVGKGWSQEEFNIAKANKEQWITHQDYNYHDLEAIAPPKKPEGMKQKLYTIVDPAKG